MKLKDINLLDVGNTIQMVGAVYADDDTMYLCLFPEDGGSLKVEHGDVLLQSGKSEPQEVVVLDMDHAEWETFIRQTDIMETEVLSKASDGTLAKIILRKSTRQIETGIQWRVWRRDDFSCVYCGKKDVPLTVDHLVCWEEGGPSVEANLVSADKKCNKIRGNLPYAEWLKHPHYKEVSKNLTPERRAANEALVATLDKIPRMVHTKSR